MSFVRSKEIPPHSGNWYDYEVETIHDGDKVIQKHIRYLGKAGTYPPIVGGSHSFNHGSSSDIGSGKQTVPRVTCKFCQGEHTHKFGKYKGVQNYFCYDCKRKFTGTDALSHGRVSPN